MTKKKKSANQRGRKKEEKNHKQQRQEEERQRRRSLMGQQTSRHALTGTLAPSEKNDPRGHPTGKSCSTLMQAVQPEKHRPLTPTLPGSGRRQQAKSRGLSAMQRTPESTWGSQRGHRCTFGGSSSLSSVGHLAPLAPGPRGGAPLRFSSHCASSASPPEGALAPAENH